MKKIAVLGAGIYNIRVYEKLRQGGFYTLAVDGNADAPAGAFADEVVHLNFTDKDAVLVYFSSNPVDAVMPINDWGTKTAAYVSEKLGLCGIPESAALAATDKGIMRETWKQHGIPNPPFFVFSTLDELREGIKNIGYPCVIKPTDSGGSGRGISVLKSEMDIEWAFEFAKPFVRNNRFICEGFVEGTELTIETITYEGVVHVLAMSDKEKPDLRTRVATSLNYPAQLSEAQEKLVEDTVKKAVAALGIHTGMAHTEVIINGMDVTMVETGARGGGGHIFHTIIEAVSGISAPVAYAELLTGNKQFPGPILKRGAVYRFFNPPHGILKEVRGIEEVSQWSGILDIGMIKKAGEEVGNLKNSLERAGHVITGGVDRAAAVELANRAEQAIEFILE